MTIHEYFCKIRIIWSLYFDHKISAKSRDKILHHYRHHILPNCH